jgi:hypothetical protein
MDNPTQADGHGHCHAKTRAGGRCKKPSGWGTDHVGTGRCKLHGGSTPTQKKAAQKQQAATAVATYGLPREIDPHTALLEELHRTAGIVAWLSIRVAELEQHQAYGPVGGGPDSIPRQEPHVWIGMYQAERKHFTAVAKTCVDVGIEERRIQLEEQQGAMLARVIDGILTDLGVRDHPEAPKVVRRHLTLVAA